MNRTLKQNSLVRLVYKKVKRILNEEANVMNENVEPLDFHPSFYNGHYYFNVTIKDKSLFGNVSNFGTDMAELKMMASQKAKQPFSKEDFNQIKNTFNVVTSNGQINDETEYVIIKIKMDDPEELFDENGKPNVESEDLKKIFNMFLGLKLSGVSVTNDDKHHALATMFHYFGNRQPNEENEKKVQLETEKLFFKICQTLGDDKTKELLRTIQITDDGYVADHQFSLNNRLRIIAQAIVYDQQGGDQVNTISYLATPRQWRKMGRQVVNFDYPYRTLTFNGGRGSQEDEIKFGNKMGLAPMRLKENKSNNVGFNAGRGLNAAVNQQLYGRESFSYNDAVYDVQATEVISGAVDKFVTEPGMKNNITGELNDVATQQKLAIKDADNDSNRTAELNNMFGTNDYANVELTYQATCMAAGVEPSLTQDDDVTKKIRETGDLIDRMLSKKLNDFKDDNGRIALAKNYLPLVAVGRIIIQAIIGLPMDNAPAIQWAEEHREIANTLSTHVRSISNKIIGNKRKIMDKQPSNIDEALKQYEPFIIYEEWFNNKLNLLMEYAKKHNNK